MLTPYRPRVAPFAPLAGLYALLRPPFVGQAFTPLISHEILHRLEHDGTAGVLAFVRIKPALVEPGLAALALGPWRGAGRARAAADHGGCSITDAPRATPAGPSSCL